MVSSFPRLANQHLKLRFFDLDAHIQSNSGTYIDLFARMYSRFRVNGNSAAGQRSAEFAVLTDADNDWNQPVMILEGEIWPLPAMADLVCGLVGKEES